MQRATLCFCSTVAVIITTFIYVDGRVRYLPSSSNSWCHHDLIISSVSGLTSYFLPLLRAGGAVRPSWGQRLKELALPFGRALSTPESLGGQPCAKTYSWTTWMRALLMQSTTKHIIIRGQSLRGNELLIVYCVTRACAYLHRL